jgi:hypothetical protein
MLETMLCIQQRNQPQCIKEAFWMRNRGVTKSRHEIEKITGSTIEFADDARQMKA